MPLPTHTPDDHLWAVERRREQAHQLHAAPTMTRLRRLVADYGLETTLVVTVAALVLQLAWPSIDAWRNRPRAGCIVVQPLTTWEKGIPGVARRYRIYLPESFDSESGPWPLLLYLHGAGERAWDPVDANQYGLPRNLGVTLHLPAIVVAPLCPPDQAWNAESLVEFLDEIESCYDVDRGRVYAMGHSMGGFGAWELTRFAPERFAAVVILGGGGRLEDGDDLADVAVWAIHGEKDTVVLPEESLELITALKANGVRGTHTLVRDEGHGTQEYPLSHPQVFEWLFSQRKPEARAK
jgi:predicted peptidase